MQEKNFGDSFDLIVYVAKVYDWDTETYSRKITRITYIAGTGVEGASRLRLIKKQQSVDPNKVWLQDIYRYDEIAKKI